MSAVPAGAPRIGERPSWAETASGTWWLRLAAVVALGLFGGAHWLGLLEDAAGHDLLAMLVIALAAGIALPRALDVTERGRRVGLLAGLTLGTLGALLLVCHAPATTLRPDHWDQLASGVGGALQELPAVRVPYRGLDPWTRTVLLLGGGLLLVGGACLSLLPRPRRLGAAICLGLLYAVPIVERAPRDPYLDGAVFALLLAFLLWGDALHDHERPMAAGLALGAVLIAAIAAPHVSAQRPWIDYEAIAESLQAGKSETFHWNHSYGPITWSRDGVELARVRTRGDVYLKTADLEDFAGGRWLQSHDSLATLDDTEIATRHPGWIQTIHVSIKGLKSAQFIGAGTTLRIFDAPRKPLTATPGTFESATTPLGRGDTYDAIVYVPNPDPTEMHDAGTDYPDFVQRQLDIQLPAELGPQVGPIDVKFPAWGSDALMLARGVHGFFEIDAGQALAGSPYRRSYALARQLQAASTDPYDYVRKVIARVNRDASYTETPPAPPRGWSPLEAFLFRDHAGYCQYFAGATALLLRMGGVPARVAVGFAPGARDGKDHVIRDLDAHSWVEAYFPHIGWVTFDPTPGDSPARSQLTDTVHQQVALPKGPGQRSSSGDRVSDPKAGGTATVTNEAGSDPTLWIVLGLAAVGLPTLSVVLWLGRRRRLLRSGDPEIEELRIALSRTGRPPGNDVTLHRLEKLLGGSDGALGYLRALRLARYGAGAPRPTPGQRRALRRALVAGLGLHGRALGLWALPPNPREVLDALRPRRRRPYTQ